MFQLSGFYFNGVRASTEYTHLRNHVYVSMVPIWVHSLQ